VNHRSADLLNDLLEVARDGERFYRDAAERVGSPELKGTFRQMAEVRQRLMDDLAQHVTARGDTPSDDRTFWGRSRKAYADVLAKLAPHHEDLYIRQLEAAEDRLLRHYENALAEAQAGAGDGVRQILQRHLLTVRAAHERMSALKNQSTFA
jgi:uncharacterized protein (TIGR02284 family)